MKLKELSSLESKVGGILDSSRVKYRSMKANANGHPVIFFYDERDLKIAQSKLRKKGYIIYDVETQPRNIRLTVKEVKSTYKAMMESFIKEDDEAAENTALKSFVKYKDLPTKAFRGELGKALLKHFGFTKSIGKLYDTGAVYQQLGKKGSMWGLVDLYNGGDMMINKDFLKSFTDKYGKMTIITNKGVELAKNDSLNKLVKVIKVPASIKIK